ncbi:MAG: HAMP domain-containing protein [Candidatus Eisenbacteria bacterium]|nr:HAMP domain-containing protein [Candidatus Eisenbacteria bacterium]
MFAPPRRQPGGRVGHARGDLLSRAKEPGTVQRSGVSIEVKIVLLVAAALVVQDLLLLVMYLVGATPVAIQIVLGVTLVLALILAGVWGNVVARAIRRLRRACFVAREGDLNVLTEPDRTDEIGELNDEINRLVVKLRERLGIEDELSAARAVTDSAMEMAPESLRSAHESLVALKELKEGAAAEVSILRRLAGALAEARTMLNQVAGRVDGGLSTDDIVTRLDALGAGAREAELLSDSVIDEVSRSDVDEAALARSVNGLRSAVRTIAQVSSEAAALLAQRGADARAASAALDSLVRAETGRADASRVAELMDRSAVRGTSEVTRLASGLRRLGLALEAYDQQSRLRR